MTSGEMHKLKVFLSYSRNDLEFADQLYAALEALDFAPTLDRVGISGAADWRETLSDMILKSDTVVFVLSPHSAVSERCAEEVAIADTLAKRIIPVVCSPLGDAPVPKRLQALNYIFFYAEQKAPGSGFGAGLGRLKTALELDQDWMREHTRFTDRATEWAAGGRAADRLLHGTDIAKAQRWRMEKPTYAPDPTALQITYIEASAAAEAKRIADQAAQDSLARDAELKRLKAEGEAERLRLENATFLAERAAAIANKRRNRSLLLITTPALAVAAAAGVYSVQVREKAAAEAQQTARAIEHAEFLRVQAENDRNKALLTAYRASVDSGKRDVAASGPTPRQEAVDVASAPTAPVPSAPDRPLQVEESASAPAPRAPSLPAASGARGAVTATSVLPPISQDAIDLIVAFEIGDRVAYEARGGQPIWPGAQSGIVIGVGYDLGYVTQRQFLDDWSSMLAPADVDRLKAVVGIKGEQARPLQAGLADIKIPFETAMRVFSGANVRDYTAQTLKAFPGSERLPPDSLGALVSLVYNRGVGFNGDSRQEMRNIRDLLQKNEPDTVADQIRAMKRLWPTLQSLQRRRDAEASLFEKGLAHRAGK